jgi:hypothetical protein
MSWRRLARLRPATAIEGRRRAGLLSWLLTGLTPLVLAAALTVLGFNVHLMAGWLGFEAILAGAALLYAGAGWLITGRLPGNAIGWLLGVIGLLVAAEMLTEQYTVYGLVTAPGSLPGARLAGWLSTVMIELALFLLLFLLLLFPDGRLPSRRWRPVLWAYLVVGASWPVSVYAVAIRAVATGDVHVLPGGDLQAVDNPAGSSAWLGSAEAVILPVLAVFWLVFVARQVLSWRRADGERRQQLKWLMGGAAVCMAATTSIAVGGTLDPSASPALQAVFNGATIGIAALPVSVGVAILKYRLYDIDRIISRTLAYAIVTGLLVGVYAGLVLLTTQVFRVHTPVAVAASTLAAAALFNPVRRRVQRAVDRRFNRARYDADRTVAAFADRLKDAVDLDSVRGDLAGVVHQALEPAHVSVWISQRD